MLNLKKRDDFVLIQRKGQSISAKGLILLFIENNQLDDELRVGVTATRKLGNAVKRNRIKRRLRALAREVLSTRAKPGYDVVLIGRHSTKTRLFADLCKDLTYCLHQANLYKQAA